MYEMRLAYWGPGVPVYQDIDIMYLFSGLLCPMFYDCPAGFCSRSDIHIFATQKVTKSCVIKEFTSTGLCERKKTHADLAM